MVVESDESEEKDEGRRGDGDGEVYMRNEKRKGIVLYCEITKMKHQTSGENSKGNTAALLFSIST